MHTCEQCWREAVKTSGSSLPHAYIDLIQNGPHKCKTPLEAFQDIVKIVGLDRAMTGFSEPLRACDPKFNALFVRYVQISQDLHDYLEV